MKIRNIFGCMKISWFSLIVFSLMYGLFWRMLDLIKPHGLYDNLAHDILLQTFFSPETWLMIAMIIVMNCNKAIEASLKTFAFCLILRLIWLLQLPPLDFGISSNIFTVFCFGVPLILFLLPFAYIAWYIRKDSILSAIIFSVIILPFVVYTVLCIKLYLHGINHYLFESVVCVAEIIFLIFSVFKNKKTIITALSLTMPELLVMFYFFGDAIFKIVEHPYVK